MAALPTIAIVDDDQAIREALCDFIKSCGYRCHLFASAEEFLAVTPAVDCMLVDVKMPGLSGIELQARLSGHPKRSPMIFITSCQDERLRRAAVAGGAFAYLEKPVDIDTLAICLEAALRG
ncbi:C4-dicarboxylate transport transcriptional regulatory protein (plasmid) [Ensifer adhaerens OV14]|nr:C4-dicarboxylate transport transcriptional regulatory protein [Ensifer adhaerens OV14]